MIIGWGDFGCWFREWQHNRWGNSVSNISRCGGSQCGARSQWVYLQTSRRTAVSETKRVYVWFQKVYSYDQQGTTACCTILLADIIVGSWEKGMHQNTSFNPSFADTSEHTVSSYYTASGAPSMLSHCHHLGKERAKKQTQTPSSEKKDENFCKSRHSSLMCLITLMLLYHITPNCTWRWCIPITR